MVLLEGTPLPFPSLWGRQKNFMGRFGDGINFATSAVRFLCPLATVFGVPGSQNKFLAFELP